MIPEGAFSKCLTGWGAGDLREARHFRATRNPVIERVGDKQGLCRIERDVSGIVEACFGTDAIHGADLSGLTTDSCHLPIRITPAIKSSDIFQAAAA